MSYPGGIDDNSTLYNAADSFSTKTLTTTLAVNALTADVTIQLSASPVSLGLASAYGVVSIDDEQIVYTAVSGNNLTGCLRGAFGTTAVGHTAGVTVKAKFVRGFIEALKAAVIAIETTLGDTGAFNFLEDPAGNGLVARTAQGVTAARTITAGANVTVTNGDGVAGNPTISAAGGSVLLYSRYSDSGSTSGTGATDLVSVTIPAGTLAKNGDCLRVRLVVYLHSPVSDLFNVLGDLLLASGTYSSVYGGTGHGLYPGTNGFGSFGSGGPSDLLFGMEIEILRVSSTTARSISVSFSNLPGVFTPTGDVIDVSAIDWTISQSLKVTVTNSQSGSMTATVVQQMTVEYVAGP